MTITKTHCNRQYACNRYPFNGLVQCSKELSNDNASTQIRVQGFQKPSMNSLGMGVLAFQISIPNSSGMHRSSEVFQTSSLERLVPPRRITNLREHQRTRPCRYEVGSRAYTLLLCLLDAIGTKLPATNDFIPRRQLHPRLR